MKKTVNIFVIIQLMIIISVCALTGCSKVPAGTVGVKVYLLGGAKGVDHEVLGVGRYWIGINEELFLFPVFTQNYVWTKDVTEGSPNDESITFQTAEGLDVNTDIGISYHIAPEKVGAVFQKYRKGVEEITDIFLRNMVRDAFMQIGSQNPVESVYGSGKTKMINAIQANVMEQVGDIGIIIEKIYLVGSMRLPTTVVSALNSKIEATQKAQQRENELREAEAAAKKVVAEAEGEAKSILVRAEAQAQANEKISRSLTPELVQYEAIKKWDGILPKMTGTNGIPLIKMD